MPPAVDCAPDAISSPPSSGRRLISRITSPFATKPRNVAEFCVDVTDRYRQYSPGDVVAGSVRLRVLKPTRVTHLTVCLHGYVQVFKNPDSPGEGYKANTSHLGNAHGKKSGEYFGNGFASLFEDEVVLCGDGRLADGSYQFNFELEFPDKDLPSSIDFERGTISYMITATMTRPTTISPTMTCDRKVYFVERINISRLHAPKARTITLEALSKRSRAKNQARRLVDASDRCNRRIDSVRDNEQHQANDAASVPGCGDAPDTPASPALSEMSFDSLISSAERTSQADVSRRSQGSSDNGTSISHTSLQPKTIMASVESLNGGCLRGDTIGIRVNVQHTKSVKSLYGVIVTLFRQARVDMHPAIPLGPTEKGGKAKYEDYYPKSLTGLGGLSLSGAGSSHVFRKDLTQTTLPLYINPSSLVAEINAKVRVPEEAFPTISTVPGGMISFKYYVEVVLDIQGKLASQDRNLGNLGGLTSGQSMMGSMGTFEGGDDERGAATPFRPSLVDTAQIRRDKGVVTCTFEVVVGTKDSERQNGKRKLEAVTMPHEAEPFSSPEASAGIAGTSNAVHWEPDACGYDETHWDQHPPPGNPYAQSHEASHGYEAGHHDHQYEQMPPSILIPPLIDESGLSEKEQMRRAEARLLPSQPPGMSDEDFSDTPLEATAPYLPSENGVHRATEAGPSAPAYRVSSSHPAPATLPADFHDIYQHQGVAPEYSAYHTGPAFGASVADDDQQEPHQCSLEPMSYAFPREVNDDGDDEAAPPSTVMDLAPATPPHHQAHPSVVDGSDSHADAAETSELPRYER